MLLSDARYQTTKQITWLQTVVFVAIEGASSAGWLPIWIRVEEATLLETCFFCPKLENYPPDVSLTRCQGFLHSWLDSERQ